MEKNYSIEYGFNLNYAIKYGVDEAIMIKNFQFWIIKNKANNKNNYDDRTWTYNSMRAFSDIFPFWSEKQISRILKSLIEQNVLITGNYNKIAYDRTLWYAFIDESIFLFGRMESPEQSNQIDETVEPIPYIKPDDKTNIIHIKKKHKFTPPTNKEIHDYCKEHNYNIDIETFFRYYTESNWHDLNGKPVRNWKLKVITWASRSKKTEEKQYEIL